MAKGFKQPGSGRAKGTKNKSTIVREIAALAGRPNFEGRKLPSEMLETAIEIAEGVVAVFKPKLVKDEFGNPKLEGGDVGQFGEWFDRWVYCMKELAKYREPQLRAIAIAPMPVSDEKGDGAKVIRLTVFEGGRDLIKPDEDAA